MTATTDPLDETPSTSTAKAPKKAKKAAPTAAKKAAPAAKKAAPAAKKAAPVAKKAATKTVKPASDVSTTQPEDKTVLAAVRKLKEPTLASQVAANLGVHRRVIRAQLIRLAKEKANGVAMKKDGFNWYVSSKAA